MDRRQRKTRESIFRAFIHLLSIKNYNTITVEEIIQIADIGRATFYAHFETKDYLLKDLCEELFEHVFDSEYSKVNDKSNIFSCDNNDDVFLHLFKHIKNNDNNICKLLSSKNNQLFLEYFKTELKEFIWKNKLIFATKKPNNIPENFWIRYITSTFIETLRWWIEDEMKATPVIINEYFLSLI